MRNRHAGAHSSNRRRAELTGPCGGPRGGYLGASNRLSAMCTFSSSFVGSNMRPGPTSRNTGERRQQPCAIATNCGRECNCPAQQAVASDPSRQPSRVTARRAHQAVSMYEAALTDPTVGRRSERHATRPFHASTRCYADGSPAVDSSSNGGGVDVVRGPDPEVFRVRAGRAIETT